MSRGSFDECRYRFTLVTGKVVAVGDELLCEFNRRRARSFMGDVLVSMPAAKWIVQLEDLHIPRGMINRVLRAEVRRARFSSDGDMIVRLRRAQRLDTQHVRLLLPVFIALAHRIGLLSVRLTLTDKAFTIKIGEFGDLNVATKSRVHATFLRQLAARHGLRIPPRVYHHRLPQSETTLRRNVKAGLLPKRRVGMRDLTRSPVGPGRLNRKTGQVKKR